MTTSAPAPLLPNKHVTIIGCPFSNGQGRAGVDGGPKALLDAGLAGQLEELGWQVGYTTHASANTSTKETEQDQQHQAKGQLPLAQLTTKEMLATDTDPNGQMKHPRTVSDMAKMVAAAVGDAAKQGTLPLTLGGDHSLGLGTVLGSLSAYPDVGLIWVDAHADLNTPATTPSGNLHGCPVAFLLGLPGTSVEPFRSWIPTAADVGTDKALSNGGSAPPQPHDAVGPLPLHRLVYIGLRDVDSGEKRFLKQYGIKAFSMHEVDRFGIGSVVEQALDYLNADADGAQGQRTGKRTRPIHLSFDVDALDPEVFPSTGTPVRGGLTFREGHYICEALHASGSLVAMDLVEVNPSLQPHEAEKSITIGCSLIRSAMGETLL